MRKLLYILPTLFVLFLSGCKSPRNDEPTNGETSYFDVNGGEYTYPNGITLKLPPGAITEGKNIFIRDLSANEVASLLNIRDISEENILFAFKGGPDNLIFERAATLVIPVERLTNAMIPMIMHIDFSENSASVANVSYIANPTNKTLELSVDHFTGYSAEIIDEINRNECTDESNTTCRCGTIEVTQTDNDYSCSVEDCQVVYSANIVKFLDCPSSPEESSIFEEVSPGCVPELTMQSEKIYIEEGEQCEITAQLKLGCAAPMGSRNVAFVVTGPGTINPSNDWTDDQGKVYAIVTGGSEEGTIAITAISSFTYFTKRINVNGVDLVSEELTVDLTNSVDVYVIKKPVLNLAAADAVIPKNDNTTITATITKDEIPVEGEIVDFSVIGPAHVDPFSSSTSTSGQAVTRLTSHDSEGTVDVLAESEVTVVLPNGKEIEIPVSGIVSVIIALEHSVWKFESNIEITTLFNPQGCEDVHVGSDCSCEGDYTGIMLTEKINQNVIGQFTLSRTSYHMAGGQVSLSDLSGTMHVHHPSSQYSQTCPLGWGLGGPGCVCAGPDRHYIRIDTHGDDEINKSISFNSSTPTDKLKVLFNYTFDSVKIRWFPTSVEIRFFPNVRDLYTDRDLYVEDRTWYSTYSDCACLGWDGERRYRTSPAWGFYSWNWEGALEDGQWTNVEQWHETETKHTFSLECVSNCND